MERKARSNTRPREDSSKMVEEMDSNNAKEKETVEPGQFEGFGWLNVRAKTFKALNSTNFLFSLLCSYFIANSTVINGLYSTSISTIEKRFLLSR